MPVEQCYVNIECELLNLCLLSRTIPHLCLSAVPSMLRVTISLLNRSTSRTLQIPPVHLQRILLQLQTYDVTIKYQPVKEMLVADALFHYAPLKAPEIPLDITINHVHTTPDRKTEFQTLIQDDQLLCSLAEMISHRLAR